MSDQLPDAAITAAFDAWFSQQFPDVTDDETQFDRGEIWDAWNAGREAAAMTADVPVGAIRAAAVAIFNAPYPKVGEGTARNFATRAVLAAAPVIAGQAAAAERERMKPSCEAAELLSDQAYDYINDDVPVLITEAAAEAAEAEREACARLAEEHVAVFVTVNADGHPVNISSFADLIRARGTT
jgi:hypothetical protein